MKRFIPCLATAALVLTASPTKAQNIPLPSEQWLPIAQTTTGDVLSMDKGSRSMNGNITTFWVQINHALGNVAVTRIYAAGNCGNNAFQPIWMLQANRQGKIVANGKTNDPPKQASPTSPQGVAIHSACTNLVTDPQTAALIRNRQINSEAMNETMRTVGSWFK